jgi:hypothetical protein
MGRITEWLGANLLPVSIAVGTIIYHYTRIETITVIHQSEVSELKTEFEETKKEGTPYAQATRMIVQNTVNEISDLKGDARKVLDKLTVQGEQLASIQADIRHLTRQGEAGILRPKNAYLQLHVEQYEQDYSYRNTGNRAGGTIGGTSTDRRAVEESPHLD